jgi:hypothetical protein
MAIEFPCHQCGKLLRVGDEAAGKQARCPSCGAVQGIPFRATPGAAGLPGAAPDESPFGRPGNPAAPSPADPANPYASPMTLAGTEPAYGAGEYWGPRTGPPWERDGASLSSFLATVKSIYASPPLFFREMRREGGLAAPLLYALAGAIIGAVAMACYQAGVQVLMLQFIAANRRGMPGLPMNAALPISLSVIMVVIFIPFMAVVYSFVGAGIFHLCLMLVGGARQAYETTFRAACYSVGSAALFGLLPICGQYVIWILSFVFTGIGLAYSHETTGGKATLAILLPVIVCCGGIIAFYAAIFGLVIANAR